MRLRFRWPFYIYREPLERGVIVSGQSDRMLYAGGDYFVWWHAPEERVL